MPTGKPSCGGEIILLQQQHNTAPGMVLVCETTAGLAKSLQAVLMTHSHRSHWVAAAALA